MQNVNQHAAMKDAGSCGGSCFTQLLEVGSAASADGVNTKTLMIRMTARRLSCGGVQPLAAVANGLRNAGACAALRNQAALLVVPQNPVSSLAVPQSPVASQTASTRSAGVPLGARSALLRRRPVSHSAVPAAAALRPAAVVAKSPREPLQLQTADAASGSQRKLQSPCAQKRTRTGGALRAQ
jgi:hypothetical protein